MTASARPLRVAHVMHSALAGSERVLVRLLSALDRARVEPLVVLPEDGPLRGELAALGVAVELVPTGWWIPATHWSAERHLAQLEGLDERAQALARLLAARGIELVHTQFIVTLEGALAAAALGLPHVWHSRGLFGGGFPPSYLDEVPFFLAGVDTLSDAVVCVSRQVEEQTATGVHAEALRVVYDGLDLAAFRDAPHETAADFRARLAIAPATPLIACIAGIQRRKGQLDLVEAAPALLARVPNAVFVLAGSVNDEEYHAALRARIAELGVEERFRFLGQLPDVRGLLAASTVLAHPSHSEGFGLGIVEAMAMGVPVVATRCGGPEAIVEDGRSGLLVPVGDAVALADALVAVLSDPARAAALGAAASRRAEAFDLRNTAAQTVAVYEEVLASRAGRNAGANESRAQAARELSTETLTRARQAAASSLLPPAAPSAPHTPPLDSWLARLRKRFAGSST